ncbi:MAG: hypothetical protein Nk1A_7380 [Endomicrobiia bacterium]|nr:MAG: hypothetical protein Nk1A_7380 [Endomicrobiia bacterium]
MKKMALLGMSLLLFYFSGCATLVNVNKFTNTVYTPVTNPENIEIFHRDYGVAPDVPYTVIAELIVDYVDSKSATELRKEAAKLGADAIIIVGPAAVGTEKITTRNVIKKESGWKAIAIKYKEK